MTKTEQRFLKHIVKTDGCWLWTGAKTYGGYGVFGVNGKAHSAHRWSYQNYVGPITKRCVCHKCDVRNCVNPDHLFLGTIKENNNDRAKKGRSWKCYGERATKVKITLKDAIKIKALMETGRHTAIKIARTFGLSESAVRDIKSGKNWSKAIKEHTASLEAHRILNKER